MEKRYQIFISSTFADLEEERKGVMEAIISLNCFPAGMEMFPATDTEQFEYIKTIIDESDYYVLIIAGRYGSVAEDGVSYTEKEFDYAKEKGVPILTFIKKNIEIIPASKTDQDNKKKKKLLAFREKAMNGRMVKFWDNASELKYNLQTSLSQEFRRNPRIGWIRGNTSADLSLYNTIENMREENKILQEKYEKLRFQIDQRIEDETTMADIDEKIKRNFEVQLVSVPISDMFGSSRKYTMSIKGLLNTMGIKLFQPFNAHFLKECLDDTINIRDMEIPGSEINKLILKMMALKIIDIDNNGEMRITDYGKRVVLSAVEF